MCARSNRAGTPLPLPNHQALTCSFHHSLSHLLEGETTRCVPRSSRFFLGRVHTTRRASTISAKHRKAEKTTSSFSKREKIRRKPFKRRNSRSISLRFLYSSRS